MLIGANKMAAAVFLVAVLVRFHTERLLFAVADGAEAICGDTQGNKILFHGAGTAIAKTEVVFGGTTLVAVAFDGDFQLWIVAQEFGGLAEGDASIGANISLVQIEIGVL